MKFTQKYSVEKIAGFFIVFFILALIFFIGVLLNQIAVGYNGGKMPVLNKSPAYSTQRHFGYINKQDVNFWYLTDVFYYNGGVFKYPFAYTAGTFSIGDFLIITGFWFEAFYVVVIFIFGVAKLFREIKKYRR